MADRPRQRLPVVTIGGFLGAGKTTLVNEILRQANGRRIVVFVNDFGAINIDHALVETIEDDRISLSNGCVCCSLNDDLVTGVADFARAAAPPDAIVVEASGVADPRALDASLDALEAAGLASLDTRLYVLDVDGFDRLEFEDAEHIIDHAAASDLILLNKSDIASSQQIAALRETLAVSAPYSNCIEADHCRVPIDLILAGKPARSKAARPATRAEKGTAHWGDGRFDHWSGQTDTPLDRRRFEDFAGLLPAHCLRAKGIVRFADDPGQSVLFHLVGHRATLEMSPVPPPRPSSQIVAIGDRRKLAAFDIDRAFRKTLSDG